MPFLPTLSLSFPLKPASWLRDPSGPAALVADASNGIGRALAHELTRPASTLSLVAWRKVVLVRRTEELLNRYEVRVEERPTDLFDPAQVEAIAQDGITGC